MAEAVLVKFTRREIDGRVGKVDKEEDEGNIIKENVAEGGDKC